MQVYRFEEVFFWPAASKRRGAHGNRCFAHVVVRLDYSFFDELNFFHRLAQLVRETSFPGTHSHRRLVNAKGLADISAPGGTGVHSFY